MRVTLVRRHRDPGLALDRASARTFDADGHLRVATSPISKAQVSPYQGAEIPDFDRLGLDPDRVYQLLRDPDELAAAAETFNGKPLLIAHRPQSAVDHDRELTVGAVNNVVWRAPFLVADLSVWDGAAIRLIETGEQRELSAAYRYVPIMEPGTFCGERYDGRMTQLFGNHVALVADGRCGGECLVCDAAMEIKMISRQARHGLTYDELFSGPKGFRGEPRDRNALADKNARTTVDESPIGRVLEYLRGRITPEDHTKLAGILSGPAEDALDDPLNADSDEVLEEIRAACESDEDPMDVLHQIKTILSRGKLTADEPPRSPGGAPRLHGQDAALRSRLATAEGVRQGRAQTSYDKLFSDVNIGGGRR